MNIFINGMGGNSETALSYILLGAFAASMTHTGLAPILSMKIANVIQSKKISFNIHFNRNCNTFTKLDTCTHSIYSNPDTAASLQ